MLGFLNKRISTLAGIIIILIVAFAVGAILVRQMNQIVEIRTNTLQSIEK